MQAIQYNQVGPPGVLKVVETPRPLPGPNQVIIKTKAISVNFADTQLRQGTYPNAASLPAIPGLEAAGRITSLGSDVTHLEVGQAVIYFGNSCYAEYILADADADACAVTPLPANVDLELAAALQVNYLTAFHLIHTLGQVKAGQTLLCTAVAGGVGTAVAQLARLAGINVIGTTSNPEKMEFAHRQGATHLINYTRENVVERVQAITQQQGADLILDSIQGPNFAQNVEMLAPLGRLIWFGSAAGPAEVDLMALMRRHAMKSVSVGVFSLYSLLSRPKLWQSSLGKLVTLLDQGKIKPVIYRSFDLSQAAQAHAVLENGQACGKILLKAPSGS